MVTDCNMAARRASTDKQRARGARILQNNGIHVAISGVA